MPNTMPYMWVKNVYNLRTDSGIISGLLSPLAMWASRTHVVTANKSLLLHPVVPGFYPHFFTVIFSGFNLLQGHLYPLSTAPTINENEEKIRKEH